MAFYLGLDSSTQGMKAEAIDAEKGIVAGSFSINYRWDLPSFRSPNGFLPGNDNLVRHADPLMWLDALEILLAKMRDEGFPMSEINGISGSAQQHGSVYLSAPVPKYLSGMTLSETFAPILARRTAPIWLDKSTGRECAWLTSRFGDRLRQDTGCPAIERFTGPQIRKFATREPDLWKKTRTVHLVSSFLCSALCGRDAPIDYCDGAGMNLLNLHTLSWDAEIVSETAPDLAKKLPRVVPPNRVAGRLSPYFEQYGLRPGIPVAVWSGDNPSSLIGVGCGEPGSAVISLGTSDTIFVALKDFVTDPDGCGHVFANPAGGFMGLICFSNGSLAREKLRDDLGMDWEFFDRTACAETNPGNNGKLMLPYFEPENTPVVPRAGVIRNFSTASASPAEQVRCLLESQALSMRRHSAWQGKGMNGFRKIRLTGGSSQCSAFRKILADVFQAKIETVSIVDSAALGAALRAANAIGGIPFELLCMQFCSPVTVTRPNPALRPVYDAMLAEYASLEHLVSPALGDFASPVV